jgi:hypothetical protein
VRQRWDRNLSFWVAETVPLAGLKNNGMNVPDILGVEVITPDGRGSVLSLHPKRVIVRLNSIAFNQVMKGSRQSDMNYAYAYEDVEVIKGQYCFNDERINFQYENVIK